MCLWEGFLLWEAQGMVFEAVVALNRISRAETLFDRGHGTGTQKSGAEPGGTGPL